MWCKKINNKCTISLAGETIPRTGARRRTPHYSISLSNISGNVAVGSRSARITGVLLTPHEELFITSRFYTDEFIQFLIGWSRLLRCMWSPYILVHKNHHHHHHHHHHRHHHHHHHHHHRHHRLLLSDYR